MENKTKRFLSLALALLMVFSMMPQITIGAKATEESTCDHANHNQDGSCEKCGSDDVHEIDWDTVVRTTDPTCTIGGYNYYACSCGFEMRDTHTEAAGHQYDENGFCTVCKIAEKVYLFNKTGETIGVSGSGFMFFGWEDYVSESEIENRIFTGARTNYYDNYRFKVGDAVYQAPKDGVNSILVLTADAATWVPDTHFLHNMEGTCHLCDKPDVGHTFVDGRCVDCTTCEKHVWDTKEELDNRCDVCGYWCGHPELAEGEDGLLRCTTCTVHVCTYKNNGKTCDGCGIVNPDYVAPSIVEVSTLTDLQDALDDENVVEIIVTAMIEIPAGDTVTLDLNGKTVSSVYQTDNAAKHIYPLDVYGNLTIQDSCKTGSITGRGIFVREGSTVTIEGGSVCGVDSNGGSALYQYGGDIIINGGLVEQKAEGTYNFAIYAAGGTVTVNGGKVAGNHGAIATVGAIVTIEGGEFVCTGTAGLSDNVLCCDGSGVLTINGGTFVADCDGPSGGCCVYDANGKATINNGNFSNSSGGDVWGTTGTTINGGTFENLIETQHITAGSIVVNGGKTYAKTESGLVECVALVGNVGYETLQAALTAAQSGDTITLLADVVGGNNLFLEFNGKTNITLAAAAGVEVSGDIQVGVHPSHVDNVDRVNSTFTVKNLTVNGTLEVISSDAKVVIQDNKAAQITVKVNREGADLDVTGNIMDGSIGTAKNGYGLFVVPNATGYDLELTGNTFMNIPSHACTVQGCGDGSAVTAAKSIEIYNNEFVSWGTNNKDNRAAFKIWADTKYAPSELSDTNETNNAVRELIQAIASGNNTFSSTAENTVQFDVYGAAGDAEDFPAPYYAAEVGGIKYESLKGAIDAANAGDTITLLADITATDILFIGKSVTIQGNEHTITSSANRIFRLTTAAIEVTMENLNMVSTAKSGAYEEIRGVSVDADISNVELTLTNCSVAFEDDSACDWSYAVKTAGNSSKHVVTIHGGTFEAANTIEIHGTNHTLNIENATLVSLYKFNQLYDGNCINLVSEGNTLNLTGNTFEGNHAVAIRAAGSVVEPDETNINNTKSSAVAYNGTLWFDTLESAIANTTDGNTIKLLADVELPSGATVNSDITLDLNGYTIAIAEDAAIVAEKSLTIRGKGSVMGDISVNGTLLIKAGTYTADVSKYLDTGLELIDNQDGTYTVQEKIPVVEVPEDVVITPPAEDEEVNEEKVEEIIVEIKHNEEVTEVKVSDGAKEAGITGVEVQLNEVKVDENTVPTKLTFDVKAVNDEGEKVEVPENETVTFRLPIPSAVKATSAHVYHNGELMGMYEIKGEDPSRYVEIETTGFSEYDLIPLMIEEDSVATIDGIGYATLQAAINAVKNGETITLIADCDENVTINRTGVKVIIDGKLSTAENATYTGKIKLNIGQNVTIQNIDFVYTGDASHDFIFNEGSPTGKNYNCTLVVDGCSFTGNGKDTTVAVRQTHPTSITVKNSTGTGLHSMLQNNGGQSAIVDNVTVTSSKSGIALQGVRKATIKNSKISVSDGGYGVRFKAATADAVITVENCEISAFIPVVAREATANNVTLSLKGTNTLTPANEDGHWCAIAAKEYEPNNTNPAEATGTVTVELHDVKLDPAKIYGKFNVKTYVAQIGETDYETLEAAIAAAKDGDTITLLTDIEIDKTLDISYNSDFDKIDITINGNGHTIKAVGTNWNDNTWMVDVAWNVVLNDVIFDANNTGSKGVQFYTSKSTLNDVTVKNVSADKWGWADYAIHGNASDLTVTGTLKFEGCKHGRMILDIGSNLPANAATSANVKDANLIDVNIIMSAVNAELEADANMPITLVDGDDYLVYDEVTGTHRVVDIKVDTNNLTLEDSLAMNFWIRTSDLNKDAAAYTVKLTRGSETREVALTDKIIYKGVEYYQVPYSGLAAKEMNDTVMIEIFEGDKLISNVFADSIRGYAEYMINVVEGNQKTALTTALVDMLNYGAAAQVEFNVGGEAANAGLTAEQQSWATAPVDLSDANAWSNRDGIGYGSNLELKNEIILHIWFKAANVAKARITVGGKTTETSVFANRIGDSIQSVAVTGLAVKDGFDTVTVEFLDGEGNVLGTVTESVASYLAYMDSKSDNALYDEIAKFITSAKAYFATK